MRYIILSETGELVTVLDPMDPTDVIAMPAGFTAISEELAVDLVSNGIVLPEEG